MVIFENFRNKKTLILIGLIVAILLILILYNLTTNRILNITPTPNSAGVDRFTKIVINFSKPINTRAFKFSPEPIFGYTIEFKEDNKQVIIIPKYPLTDNTRYLIRLEYPTGLWFSFITEKLPPGERAGQSNQYLEESAKLAEQQKQQLVKDQAIAKMRKSLPVDKVTFSLRYVISSNTFIATLKGDKARAEGDLNNWLQQQGIDPTSIEIQFGETDSSSFSVLKTSLNNQTVGVYENVVITFSDPIRPSSLVVNIEPKTEVLFDLDRSLTEVTIRPRAGWKPDTNYTITIPSSVNSQDNQKLPKDYLYSFKTQLSLGI